jgi:hypothetical protein
VAAAIFLAATFFVDGPIALELRLIPVRVPLPPTLAAFDEGSRILPIAIPVSLRDTCLAVVAMPVPHAGLFVELRQRLLPTALDTDLHLFGQRAPFPRARTRWFSQIFEAITDYAM